TRRRRHKVTGLRADGCATCSRQHSKQESRITVTGPFRSDDWAADGVSHGPATASVRCGRPWHAPSSLWGICSITMDETPHRVIKTLAGATSTPFLDVKCKFVTRRFGRRRQHEPAIRAYDFLATRSYSWAIGRRAKDGGCSMGARHGPTLWCVGC